MLNSNYLKKMCGNYYFANNNAVNDNTLIKIASESEKKFKKSIPFLSEKNLTERTKEDADFLATIKYDGEGTYLYYKKNNHPTLKNPEIFLFNPSSGRVRVGLPCLEKAALYFKKKEIESILSRVELYLPNLEKRRRTIFDVTSISSSKNINDIKEFKIAAISIKMFNGESWVEKNIIENWKKLEEIFGTDKKEKFHRVHGIFCTNKELKNIYKEVIKNEEGMVIHNLSSNKSFKIKPKRTIDATIIGYTEDIINNTPQIKSILTALTYPENENQKYYQSFCKIYSGISEKESINLLSELKTLKVKSPIQMTDTKGRIFQFIKPRLIIETKGEEIITTKRDNPNKSQLFEWKNEKWEFRGIYVAPKLTFATYQGIRKDKTISEGGARITQAVNNQKTPTFENKSKHKPEIVTQKYWVKHLKSGEQIGLKKVTIIKNNNKDYMPYTIIYTDYSHKRKEPLKINTEYANTETRIFKLLEKWNKSLTKGWKEIKKNEIYKNR